MDESTMKELQNKRVLITGAGGALGRELSIAFAAAGCEVVATDIDHSRADETVHLVQSLGGRAAGFLMDVTDSRNVEMVRQEIHSHLGPVDILVNNAGIVAGGFFLDVPLEDHQAVMAVNSLGPLIVTYAFLPDLLSHPEAHLVNISSASGMLPTPLQSSYTASKWAALGLSDTIRQELRIEGYRHIGVTSVCPGYIESGMFRGVHTPRLSTPLSPKWLAQRIVRAVKRNKNYVLVPWLVKIIPIGKLFPMWLGQKLIDWLRVSDGMRTWVGHSMTVSDVAPKAIESVRQENVCDRPFFSSSNHHKSEAVNYGKKVGD
jgi:NAD(P)-dependent dehydrogenase (short-subunit alcohol dehydrogenase family)